MEVQRYQSSPSSRRSFFVSAFSNSEDLGRNASIRSTLAGLRRKERKVLYVESDFGTAGKSFTVFFAH